MESLGSIKDLNMRFARDEEAVSTPEPVLN
jgi:hypothetical protein